MSNNQPLLRSKTFFISDPTPSDESQSPFKKSVTIAADEDPDASAPDGMPQSSPRKLKRALTVRSTTFVTHRTEVRRKVIYTVILFFLMLLERLFIKNLRPDEDISVAAIQSGFGVTYESNKWFLQFFLFLENGFNFYIVALHIFLIMYYYVSPITGLKIMHVTLNFWIIICILEIVYGAPRPFWDTTAVVGAECESSYAFPSLNIFTTLFVFRYTKFCLRGLGEKAAAWTTKKFIIHALFGIFLVLFCLSRVVSGVAYISQTLFTLAYATVAYYIATFYDKEVTSIVEKSSIDINAAKRYTMFWLVYIVIVGAFAAFFYEGANPYLQNNWVSNFIICLANYNETGSIPLRAPFHLIGPWESYIKTVVLVLLLGIIFGSAKTFRDFKGVIWYAVEPKKKLIMTIIANLCLIPSWVFIELQNTVLSNFMNQWLNRYFINLIHFFIVAYVIFGVLPKYVFDKLGLVKKADTGSFINQSGYMDKKLDTGSFRSQSDENIPEKGSVISQSGYMEKNQIL